MPIGDANGSSMSKSRPYLAGTFAEYGPHAAVFAVREDGPRAHHRLRFGDRTVLLPGAVFEADTGRSYRSSPKVRSIWVRNFGEGR